jgi:hypothetical protein
VLLVVALVATTRLETNATPPGVAQQDAQQQRDTARAAQHQAQDQRDSARLDALVNRSLALRSTNRTVAALLAVEAYNRRPDAAAWSALLGTFTATPSFAGYQYLPAAGFVTGALVPGTTRAVVALDGRDLALVDLGSGEVDHPFPPAPDKTVSQSVLRVSDDGRFVARLGAVSGNQPATLSVYEIATGRLVLGPLTPPFHAADVSINADGSLIAVAGGATGDLAVYRVAGAQPVGVAPGLPRPDGIDVPQDSAALAFGLDGLVYLGSIVGAIRVVDPSTLQVVASYEAPLLSSHNQIVVTPGGLRSAGARQSKLAPVLSSTCARRLADLVPPRPSTHMRRLHDGAPSAQARSAATWPVGGRDHRLSRQLPSCPRTSPPGNIVVWTLT